MKYLSYLHIQVIAWSAIFVLMTLSVVLSPVLVYIEILYAFILVTAAAFCSDGIRRIYKYKLYSLSIVKQALALALLSLVFAALATMVLVIAVFIISTTSIAFPIAPGRHWFVVQHVFWANWINFSALMLLWSSLYFAITRVRLLDNTKKVLEQTQLEVLQNQLNPHFLFNAMNNIRALILEDTHKSRDMIAALSDILRYSITKEGSVKVPLKEELAFIINYIDLCKIQFEDRLQFTHNISGDLNHFLVPKMVIQLCIENAIKHGIEPSVNGGEISLHAELKEQMLHLTVKNTADTGMPKSESLGVGLSNLKSRLKLLYNGAATFNVKSTENTFVVEMALPAETRGPNQ